MSVGICAWCLCMKKWVRTSLVTVISVCSAWIVSLCFVVLAGQAMVWSFWHLDKPQMLKIAGLRYDAVGIKTAFGSRVVAYGTVVLALDLLIRTQTYDHVYHK